MHAAPMLMSGTMGEALVFTTAQTIRERGCKASASKWHMALHD